MLIQRFARSDTPGRAACAADVAGAPSLRLRGSAIPAAQSHPRKAAHALAWLRVIRAWSAMLDRGRTTPWGSLSSSRRFLDFNRP